MLPAQEWEIARLLTKLSALRTEHHDFTYGGSTPRWSRPWPRWSVP